LDPRCRLGEHHAVFSRSTSRVVARGASVPRRRSRSGCAIFRQFVDFTFLLIKWTAGLALIVALAVAAYFYHRLDDEVRLAVETRLAQHYAKLKVTVHEAQLVRGEGIRVRGVSIADPNRGGPEEPLLYVDEV